MGGSGGAAVHTTRSRHLFAFACTACCNNLLKAVIVTSEDTDVMFFFLVFQKDVPSIRSVGHRTAHDLSRLANWPGDWRLIGLHAFTGCYTVSAFASRRKLNALKPMQSDITYLKTFSQVGQSWNVQPQLSEKVQQFTCRMYVAASSNRGERPALVPKGESSLLPPCR